MTAAAPTEAEIAERFAAIEESLNEGFLEVAEKMGIGGMLERTGARMVVSNTVSPEGVNIDFKLEFTKVDVTAPLKQEDALDVLMVEEYAKVFAKNLLKR